MDYLDQKKLEANQKSVGVAYLLWFFLGGFGAHRFYLEKITSAIIMILCWFVGAGGMFYYFYSIIDTIPTANNAALKECIKEPWMRAKDNAYLIQMVMINPLQAIKAT